MCLVSRRLTLRTISNHLFQIQIDPSWLKQHQSPKLDIPHSDHTVSVSIIDTTTRAFGLPAAAFMQPDIPGFSIMNNGRSYSFIIKHKKADGAGKADVLLFDLGVRQDFHSGPKMVVDQMVQSGVRFEIEKSVADILKENGEDPGNVDAIIWSHYHVWDHTGDPSTFPTSVDLIIGPGFKEVLIPAWPTNEYSQIDEKAWEGRELREIDFDTEGKGLKIGQYKAFDFYGDGSFYLIDSPGHATGHMCALARTSTNPSTFILMGGDVAHHGGEFRPTEYKPLPEQIDPNPLEAPFTKSVSVCPGSLFQAIHPKKSSSEPFMQATGFLHDDSATACQSIEKLFELDAQDDIFSVVAHDVSLADVVDFYPKPANDWKAKGWKEQSFWRFLADFDTAGK